MRPVMAHATRETETQNRPPQSILILCLAPEPPHVPCRHRRRDHSNVASDPFPTWHETPDANTDAQLEYCVHFGMNLAAKRVSSMPCQTHAIATLALGVRGGPRQRSAKNDGYWTGAHDPLVFVVGRFPGTESELRSRIPDTTPLPHLT